MSDNNTNNEPKFNEYRAYEELRMIFVIAIETQNFSNLEANIAAWEKKYPLDDFIDTEILRKVKAILNKDFLTRLIGDYLAAQVLHEQEKQKKAYLDLKNIMDLANESKDYARAEVQIRKWKNDLHSQDLSIYSFNRYYKAKICTMLLVPSKELSKQAEATHDLKILVDKSKDMDRARLSDEISQWQNKYTLGDFPDKLQQELNDLTSNIFESILVKTNQENALTELREFIATSENISLDSIAKVLEKYDLSTFDSATTHEISILSQESVGAFILNRSLESEQASILTPTYEFDAINNLKKLLSTNSHDLDSLVNWIYENRGINFSSFAREEIIQSFYSADFKIPKQATYSMPEIHDSLSFKEFSEIDSIRESVIVNYLGLLSQGKVASTADVENLSKVNSPKIEIQDIPTHEEIIQVHPSLEESETTAQEDFSFALPVFDNASVQNGSSSVEFERQPTSSSYMNDEEAETAIQSIITEDDLLKDPLATYSLDNSHQQDFSLMQEEAIPSEVKVKETTGEETIHSIVIDDASISIPVLDNNDDDINTNSQNADNPILSPADTENLKRINDNSTYIVVAIPILDDIFRNRVREQNTEHDIFIQKK